MLEQVLRVMKVDMKFFIHDLHQNINQLQLKRFCNQRSATSFLSSIVIIIYLKQALK